MKQYFSITSCEFHPNIYELCRFLDIICYEIFTPFDPHPLVSFFSPKQEIFRNL